MNIDSDIISNWFDGWDINKSNGRHVRKSIRLRIVAIAPYYHPRIGGGETQLRMISNYLAAKGHYVTVLTLHLPNTQRQETLDGVEILRFGTFDDIGGRIDGYVKICDYLEQHLSSIDILYIHLGIGSEYPTPQMCHILLMAQEHKVTNVVRIASSGRVTQFRNEYKKYLSCLLEADLVIALNPGIKRELLNFGLLHSKIFLVPNGINISLFQPSTSDSYRHKLRHGIGLPNTNMICVCHSRFASKKNIPALIRNWGKFVEQHSWTKNAQPVLCLVGSSIHEANGTMTMRKIDDAIRSLHTGSILEFSALEHQYLSRLLKSVDAYISISLQEGMSNALLESMSSGLLCIVPDTIANRVLIKDGFNGLLFDSTHSDGLFSALNRALSMGKDEWRILGMRSRILCEKHLKHNMIIDTLEEKFIDLYLYYIRFREKRVIHFFLS